MSSDEKKNGILLEAGTNEVEFLVVHLGTHRYGINVAKVRTIQVFDPNSLAPLPNQRKEVLGLIPFRDSTIAVVDLRMSVNADQYPGISKPLLVVSEFNRRTNGFVVDGVDRIERCSWSKFEPITEVCCNSNEAGIVGTIRLADGLVIVLDLENIMGTIDPTMSVEHFAKDIGQTNFARSNVKIVHCDDSVVIRKLVSKILSDAGFAPPKQFDNGESTFQYLSTAGKSEVDIVISDIEMPRMDGLALCRNLRGNKEMGKLPVVFFSSLIDDQMLEKCKAVGGDGAFSKPQINFLVESIESLLSKTA